MMSLENILWIAGVISEVTVVGILLYRRSWKALPFFFAFCVWDLLSDAGNYVVLNYYPNSYSTFYLLEAVLDTSLEISVLVELAWSVLRPIRSSLSKKTLPFVAAATLLLCAGIWPFSGLHMLTGLAPQIQRIVHVQQTATILRVLFFLALAASSQLLSIGWRDRELQVATGLGFYSLVSLGAAMLHTHQTSIAQYSHLNQFVAAGYVCSLLYWAFSFAQNEAPRREFTPQMQSFLLAVAGAARADRIALAQSTNSDARSRHDL